MRLWNWSSASVGLMGLQGSRDRNQLPDQGSPKAVLDKHEHRGERGHGFMAVPKSKRHRELTNELYTCMLRKISGQQIIVCDDTNAYIHVTEQTQVGW